MKIKFSRVMAIVCALSVAFAGLTAFAAKTGDVEIVTTYDAYKDGTANDVTVTAKIYGEANKEVTYYVAKDGNIVYINQYTVPADPGYATAKFTTSHAGLLSATAKFGTDAAANAFAGTEFKFAEGCNYLTNSTPDVIAAQTANMETYETFDENGNAIVENGAAVTATGTAYKAKVSGNVIEYGIKVGEDLYPAAGCLDDGTYMVILNGVNVTGKTISAYAIDADGKTMYTAAFGQ